MSNGSLLRVCLPATTFCWSDISGICKRKTIHFCMSLTPYPRVIGKRRILKTRFILVCHQHETFLRLWFSALRLAPITFCCRTVFGSSQLCDENWYLHCKNKTSVFGNPTPVLGMELKRGENVFWYFFIIDLCSVTSIESSRRDLLNDKAEHRPSIKNKQNTQHILFDSTPKTGILFLPTGFCFYCLMGGHSTFRKVIDFK